MPESGAEILARIQPQLNEDWIELSLRPDLMVKFVETKAELEESRSADGAEHVKSEAEKPTRMGEKAEPTEVPLSKRTKELLDQVTTLEEQLAGSMVKFSFRALARDAFRALCADFGPREGDQYDQYVGYDRESVNDALVRASLLEPEFDDSSWLELVKVLGKGQWQQLVDTANEVNGSVVNEPPKSELASWIRSSSASASKPQRGSRRTRESSTAQ